VEEGILDDGSGVESGDPPDPELTEGGGGVFETRSAISLREGRF
jgi:hypothetical protein